MTIAEDLTRIQTAKADLKTAIEGKGVTVSADALLDAYPDYVDAIVTGGGTVKIDVKTKSTSQYPTSITFTEMKGQPKVFFLKSTTQISSGSTTYYYVIAIVYDGTSTRGSCFRIGGTRRVDPVSTGYSFTYSNGTLTISSSASSRSYSPGAFNSDYELVYVY